MIIATLSFLVGSWDYILAGLCFAIAATYFLVLVFVTHHMFWDVNFYASVVKAMSAGISPYDNAYISQDATDGFSLGFMYPPFAAQIFYKFDWLFLTAGGRAGLAVAQVLSWIAIPYLLAGSPARWYSRSYLYVWALYLVLFGLAGMRLLVVGNISALLFSTMIFAIVVAVRTGKYTLFWITIVICSFVKFYFLIFLMFPVILDKKYSASIIAIAILLGLFALNYVVSPMQFSEYLRQIGTQSNEVGLSIFSLATRFTKGVLEWGGLQSFILPLAVYGVVSITILGIAFAVAEQRRPETFDLFCCWLFLAAFLISPRMYDFELAVVTVPFVLLARMLLLERGIGISVAAVAIAMGFLLVRNPPFFGVSLSDWTASFAIFGVWLGAGIHWLYLQDNAETNASKI